MLLLLKGYSRVESMIEIEVEMNTEVRRCRFPPSCLLVLPKLARISAVEHQLAGFLQWCRGIMKFACTS